MTTDVIIKVLSDYPANVVELIFNGKIIKRKKIHNIFVFQSNLNMGYAIRIITYNSSYLTCIYVKDVNKFIIDIRSGWPSRKVFIKLLDANYEGLKVEEGEIKLWLSHTQLRLPME